jgi:hypothetical protein
MVRVKYDDLLLAFEFANAGAYAEDSAYVDLETGAIHCVPDYPLPEVVVPEDLRSSDRYAALPHKNDLDLGRRLVLNFIDEHLPEHYDRVAGYFRQRGAYARFKDLLADRGALDAWYRYESEATERALRDWCKEQGIEFVDDDEAG